MHNYDPPEWEISYQRAREDIELHDFGENPESAVAAVSHEWWDGCPPDIKDRLEIRGTITPMSGNPMQRSFLHLGIKDKPDAG